MMRLLLRFSNTLRARCMAALSNLCLVEKAKNRLTSIIENISKVKNHLNTNLIVANSHVRENVTELCERMLLV